MLVSDSDSATDVKEVQPKNALLPIPVTELGIVTDVKEMQSSKAELWMEVTA